MPGFWLPAAPSPACRRRGPGTGCSWEGPLSPPGPFLIISARVDGMEATAGGTPGGPFPTGGSRGQGRGQRPAGVSPLGPGFHRPLSQLVNNQPQVPGRLAMKGHCGHSGGRRELGLHLLPPRGIPSPPEETQSRKPPLWEGRQSPALGSPSLVGGEAGAKAHLLRERMVCPPGGAHSRG